MSSPLSNFLDDTRIVHNVATDTAYATVLHTRRGTVLCTSMGTRCHSLEDFVAQHYAARKTAVPPNTNAWSACRFFKAASERWISCEEMLAPSAVPRPVIACQQQSKAAKGRVVEDSDTESEFDYDASDTDSETESYVPESDYEDDTDEDSELGFDVQDYHDDHADGDDDTYKSESESDDSDDETYVPESDASDTDSEDSIAHAPRIIIKEEHECPWAPKKIRAVQQRVQDDAMIVSPLLDFQQESVVAPLLSSVTAPVIQDEAVVLPRPEPPTPLPSPSIVITVHRVGNEMPEEITIFYDRQRASHQVVSGPGTAVGMPQDYFRLLLEYLRLDSTVVIDLAIPCFPHIRSLIPAALRSDQVETLVRCTTLFFCSNWNM